MASAQCYIPEQQKTNCGCHQEQKEHSLTQKVSEMAGSIFKGHGSGSHQSQGHSHGQTETESHYTHHRVVKTQTQHCYGQTEGHHTMSKSQSHTNQNQFKTNGHSASGTATAIGCHGKTQKRGERKKTGLLQKIKDGFSSDDNNSNSSDSESDDEKCHRKC